MKQHYIIDGYFFLYRARHGYSSMRKEEGDSLNVIYWFFRMLLTILAEKPHQLIVARDSSGKIIREELLESYKANRATMPDDFRDQVRACKLICEELWFINIAVPGYEADDIMYTIVKNSTRDHQIQYTIYSADKDLKQVLQFDNIEIVDPIKEIRRTKSLFTTEFWFPPEQIVDYLSLIGDASDNVPWAKWIGPKWASDLICKRWTIENIYNNIDNLTEKQQSLLLESRENVEKAKKLILLYDVPDCIYDCWLEFKPDIVKRKEIFVSRYNFASFTKTLDELKKMWYFMQDGGLFG